MFRRITLGLVLLSLVSFRAPLQAADEKTPSEDGAVSYYTQIRPIFQANCQGCHQPAKASGEYVMTQFDRLVQGGESETAAVVPGKPDESYLLDLIVPQDGEAEMPREADPLTASEITLIRRWIAQGAKDDTPVNAGERYDMEHPPVYTRPPVVTSIDYAPDGQNIAIAGFHEVLLFSGDGAELTGRLVGLSDRIEQVRFSPDGQRLLVTGGLPGRMGEIQVWDVEKQVLQLSLPVAYDTVYGGNWSPDGKFISYGLSDNTVRVIEAETGKQVMFQGAHDDWIRDTVFSQDGSHVVSAGRDMTVKLTEVATQRFVDNVTSITPGALKGGVQTISRHPERDEIVIGGADGVVKVYRIFRLTKRVIGDDSNMIRRMPPMNGRVFSVDVSADGKRIVAGSSLNGAGQVHVYGYEFDTSMPDEIKKINETRVMQRSPEQKKKLDEYHTQGVELICETPLPAGGVYAVTFSPDNKTVAAAGADGRVRLIDAATGSIVREFSPAEVAGALDNKQAKQVAKADAVPDFIRDVNPILSRVGCNAGTCHGAAKGRNGFKLSLRGYDALFDVRALTDDLASRRVNVASPDDSLMLLKATSAVAHEGGQLFKPGDPYYQIIRDWIAGGAELKLSAPRVTKIAVQPEKPVIEDIGGSQAMQVIATYSDGSTRDVTREAFVESSNTEVATADRSGGLTAVRRGEAAVLARYEGAYDATTLTVMGDRDAFSWQPPETWNRIDELVAAKWKRMKIQPSGLCTDAEFIRRVYLDLTGLPPTAEQVTAFLEDARDTQVKRYELIDQLIGNEEFVEYWTNKWADLLQVNRKFLGAEGAKAFRAWIHQQVAAKVPYDEFARELLTAQGSNRENPAASYFKILRDPLDTMENTTHLFMGVRFNCNKCHDHPFERWTQDQYYETAAYFARLGLKPDPESGDKKIGGTAVEGAKPLYEIVVDKQEGEVIHDRTQKVAAPEFPFDCEFESPADATRREQLAAWITSPDNPYFARSYVNRLWGYLLGVGLIEPLDDIRAGNPPTNPELLDHLTEEFVNSGFDMQQMLRYICRSRTYQLSLETNPWNADDQINYSHATARRLPAEVLYDAIHRVTGSVSKIPGLAPGTRAAEIPDAGVELSDGFLANLGRPSRESACECERSSSLQLGPIMALISGPTVDNAISDRQNALAKLAAEEPDDRELINKIFLRILNRPAELEELQAGLSVLNTLPQEHQQLVAELDAYQKQLQPAIDKQEAARQQRIKLAKAELEAYESKVADREARLDQEHQEKLAAAEAALQEIEATLETRLAAWEKEAQQPTAWQVIDPVELSTTNGAKLNKHDEQSILATGPNAKGSYKVVARTELPGITGIRLEALADESLPNKGPGRPQNGNFVLTEFRVELAPEDQPDKATKVALQNAQADFSQEGYDVSTAIDGKLEPQSNGWATSPKLGENRTAVFEIAERVGAEEGKPSRLTFWLDHQYQDGKHQLGRFRISVTTSPRPIRLEGLPQEIAQILAVDAEQRTDKQKADLLKYYRSNDAELQARMKAVAEAQKPRAVDPELQKRREKLAEASQPLPVDPKLAQLQRDVEMSQQQLENARLTFAQDLAWALINNSAFLFNR